MKKNYKVYLVTSLILFVVLSISIGYSAFGTQLHIDDIVLEYRIKKDIRVTNLKLFKTTDDAKSKAAEYNYASISDDIVLPNANSTITYKVQITNIGTEPMGIFDITGLPSNLTYKLSGYNLKQKICDELRCSQGVIQEFNITIEYADKVSVPEKTEYNIQLNIDFRGFHKVTYVDIDNNGYPTEVMDGASLNVTFVKNIPSVLQVYHGLEKLYKNQDFTYENGNLKLSSVTDDVKITDLTHVMYEYIAYNSGNKTDESLDFSNVDVESGIYELNSSQNQKYPVYYYRGDEVSNNVIFGGFCWKIVRTTDTGGTKLIYNGNIENITDEKGGIIQTCPGNNPSIESSGFPMAQGTDKNDDSIASVGYMYGTMYGIHHDANITKASSKKTYKIGKTVAWEVFSDTQPDDYTYNIHSNVNITSWSSNLDGDLQNHHYSCLSTSNKCGVDKPVAFMFYYDEKNDRVNYLELKNGITLDEAMEKMVANKNNSGVKEKIDSWYKTDLYKYEDYLENTPYCNDRNILDKAGFDPESSITIQYLTFKGQDRVYNHTPTLECDTNNSFTVKGSSIGNEALDYPIGLLTADEAIYAGAINYVSTDETSQKTYLSTTDDTSWLMTPDKFNLSSYTYVFGINSDGNIQTFASGNNHGIRPVISLKYGVKYETGDGTVNNPYYVNVGEVSNSLDLYQLCNDTENMKDCINTKSSDLNRVQYLSDDLVGDMYRYQGTASQVNNNYICFGTTDQKECINNPDKYLYRIIGIDSDGKIKVVKKESLENTYQWYSDITTNINWPDSLIYDAISGSDFLLNTNYVPEGWSDKIDSHIWMYGDLVGDDETNGAKQIGTEVYKIENGEIPARWYEPSTVDDENAIKTEQLYGVNEGSTVYYLDKSGIWNSSIPSKVGLMNISDYYLSVSNEANCQKSTTTYGACSDGWLNLANNDPSSPEQSEWLMSRTGWSYNWGRYNSFSIHSEGYVDGYSLGNKFSVRPVFYLDSSISITSGNGRSGNPYIIGN